MRAVNIVVAAASSSFGIGKNGDIPWNLPPDLAHFKALTTSSSGDDNTSSTARNAVIMGRRTWESIPKKFRPLQNRINVVLSRNLELRAELLIPDEVLTASSLDEAIEMLTSSTMTEQVGQIFVIGGSSLYEETLRSTYCRKVYLTLIDKDFDDCDTFFPRLDATKFHLTSRSAQATYKELPYSFCEFTAIPRDGSFDGELTGAKGTSAGSPSTPPPPAPAAFSSSSNKEEMQYLCLCDDIINNGVLRGDRTGTGTLSKFGAQMRFSLRAGRFPLLTTKRVFWRGVAEELLWFVKGSTNANELAAKDIHIWDGNGSKDFLEKRGLGHREEGDLGPVYGFQWRHFGASYEDMHTDYKGQGVDQLVECINKIKNSPEDRRIIMTAWNPADLDKMALPPCHMFCQFYVANGELSCLMYQRSADMGLGVPFNIASYSLLTRLVAQVCGLEAGDFVHTIGDAHVYVNHVEALKEQISRSPLAFPTLTIDPSVGDIDGFDLSHFTIQDYNPMKTIKMKMAV
jgi:dihydrofolate reductase/thymidylate synthase